MKNRSIEAKVGYGGAAGAIVTGFFGTLAWLAPHVHQPPAYLVALYVTIVSLVAGYLAPHTSRLKPLTPSNLTIDELAGLAHAIGAEVVAGTHPTTGTALPVVTAKTPPDLDVTQGYTTPPAQPTSGTTRSAP